VFDIITIGKRLVASVLARDLSAALRDAGELLPKLADLYDTLRGGTVFGALPGEKDQLAEVADEITAATNATAGNVVGFDLDWAKALEIARVIADLIRRLRDK